MIGKDFYNERGNMCVHIVGVIRKKGGKLSVWHIKAHLVYTN